MTSHELRIVQEHEDAMQRAVDEAHQFIVGTDDSAAVANLADLLDDHPALFAARYLRTEREVEQLHQQLRAAPSNVAQARAIAAIQAITDVGERLAQAHARIIQIDDERPLVKAKCIAEMIGSIIQIDDERPLVKAKCIAEMIGSPNPVTNKPHSATSAESVVEQHADFWALRRRQEAAEVEKHRAEAMFAAAVRMADLEVEAYRRAKE